jgi:hypothetical protein
MEQEDESLGSIVEKAINLWLAVYYLGEADARSEVPEEDRKVIEEAVRDHGFRILSAAAELESEPDPRKIIDWEPSEQRLSPDELEELIQQVSDEQETEIDVESEIAEMKKTKPKRK